MGEKQGLAGKREGWWWGDRRGGREGSAGNKRSANMLRDTNISFHLCKVCLIINMIRARLLEKMDIMLVYAARIIIIITAVCAGYRPVITMKESNREYSDLITWHLVWPSAD